MHECGLAGVLEADEADVALLGQDAPDAVYGLEE